MFQRAWIVAAMMAIVVVISTGDAPAASELQKPGQKGAGKGSGQVIKKLDTDKDGQLSKAEFEAAKSKAAARGKGKAGAARGKVFDRLDTNGDGSLSAAELKKLQEMRNRRAKAGSHGGLPK